MNYLMRLRALLFILLLHLVVNACVFQSTEISLPETTIKNSNSQTDSQPNNIILEEPGFRTINPINIALLENTENWMITEAIVHVWMDQGNQLAIGSDSQIMIYDRNSGGLNPTESLDVGGLRLLTTSKVGEKIIWSDSSNNVYVFDLKYPENREGLILRETSPVTGLAISDDETLIAVSTINSGVEIIASSDYQDSKTLISSGIIFNLAFSPDNKYLFGVERESFTAFIWDLESREISQTLCWDEGVTSSLSAASISPNWNQVGWNAAEIIQLMDYPSAELGELLLHEDAIGTYTWSNSGEMLVTSSIKQSGSEYKPIVYFWDSKSGQVLFEIIEDNPVIDIKFSPKYDDITILSSGGKIAFWSVVD